MPDDLGSIVDRLTAAAQASPAAPAEEPAQPAWQGNVDRLLFAAGAPTERSFTPESFAAHRQRADVTEYGGAAQQEFQNFQPGGGEDVLRHSLPFVSAAITGIDRQAYSRARQAVAEGRAGPEEYRTVARYERRQQLESQHTSTGELAARGLMGIPAMLGEGYVGGAALRGLGLFGRAAAPVAEAASAPLTARAVAGFAGRTALQTATMPSMYVDQWTRRNLEEGRAANDWRGLPSAAALGMLQTAVLGSLGKFGNAISTAGVRGVAERLITRTAVGMLEQQGVDLFASAVSELLPRAYKLETGYGLLGHAIRREGGQFWQAALVQGVTFAAFSGIHEIQHGRPASAAEHREIIQTRGAQVLDAIQGTVDRLHEEGVPRERAGHSMAEFFGQVEGAMQGPQGMTPAQALEAALARTPAGPVRDMGTTLTELFPSVGERLGRQPAEPRELPPATAGPMQVPSRSPSLSDLSRPRVPEPPPALPLASLSHDQVKALARDLNKQGANFSLKGSREQLVQDMLKLFGEANLRRLAGEQVPEQPATAQPPPTAPPSPETATGTAPQPPTAPEAAPTPPNAAPTQPGPSAPVRQPFQGPTEVSTARLKAKGWSDKQIAEAQAEGLHAADAVTGFHEGRTGAVRHETVERAIEHTARTGEPGAYVEIDLRNLGGINATLGHEGANGFFGRVAAIIREELAGTQADVSLFRHGGDELSAVVVNGSRESVTDAMRRAHARIQEAAKEAGLESIEHPKHKGVAERRGTGIYFGVADLAKDSTPERLFSEADKEVEARKASGLAAPLGRVSKMKAAMEARRAAQGNVPTPVVQPQPPAPPSRFAEAKLTPFEEHAYTQVQAGRDSREIAADPETARLYGRQPSHQTVVNAANRAAAKLLDVGSAAENARVAKTAQSAAEIDRAIGGDAARREADSLRRNTAVDRLLEHMIDHVRRGRMTEEDMRAVQDAMEEAADTPGDPKHKRHLMLLDRWNNGRYTDEQLVSKLGGTLQPLQGEGQRPGGGEPAQPPEDRGAAPVRPADAGVQPGAPDTSVASAGEGGPGGNGPAAPTGPAQVPGQAGANRPEGPPALAGGGQAPGDLVARKAELTRRREELERRSEQLQEVYLDARKATKDAERRGDTEGVARNRIGVEHLERQINEVQAQMEVAIVHEANPSLASREQGDWRVRLWTYHKPDGAELARFQTEAAAAKAAAQAKTDFGDSGYRFAVERVPSKDTGGDLTALLSAIRKHGGRHNLADLLALRKELGWERERFDAAFREARLARLVHGEAREGRHGVTEEQRAADVSEDPQDPSRTVGYASLSEAGKAQVYTPVHLEQPKPQKAKSLYSVVRESGGIDPASVSFLASYRGVREALQDGLTLGIFKKGGRRLDELAQELHGSGHTDSPEPARLLELLRDKAVTMQADQSRQLAREQAEYERMRHELEQEEAAHVREHQDEINETLRAGEESGQAEAASEPFDQGGQESDDAGRRGQNLFGETTVEAGSLFDTPGLKDQPSRPRSFAELQADKREREAIAAARSAETPLGSEGLEPHDWFGEPTPGEPRATGGDDGGIVHRRAMGAAALGELTPPGRESEGQRATALANARIDTERRADGLSPVLNSAKRERPEAWAKAMERFDRDPDAGRKLADELADKPRATNDVENIMLLRERVQAATEFRRLDKLMERPGMDVLDLEASQKQADEWLQRMYTADTAARRSGTEWAWAGITRQQLMAEDFSFDGMLSQFRRSAGRDPTPEERKRIAELSDKIKALQAKLDASEKRYAETQRGPQSEEYTGMKDDRVAVAGAQADFGKIVTRAKEGRRTWGQTIGDLLIKLRVNEVISGLGTVGKLGMSSLQRLTITPLEEIGGMVWARVPGLAKIAALAPREGKGFSWVTEKQAVASGLVQGLKDAWRTIRTGESELDILYGDKSDKTRSWLDWQFALHAGIKAPAVRAEYTRSFLKRLEQAAARGEDATSPAALMRHGLLAYKDSQAAKFQQENWLVDAYNKAVSHMRKPDMPVASQAIGTIARLLTPVVRIPTNLAFETARYAFGLGTGTVQAMRAHWITGLENLKPAEADAIMQQFKKGSLGMAAMLVGAMNPGMFGGYYTGRRPDDDVRPGAVRIGGVNIGSWTQHNPLLQVFQVGAAFRRAYDTSVRHGEGGASATGTAAWEAMSGWFQEIPLVRETGQVAGLFNHNARERGYYLGELAKSFAVPQFFQWLAGRLDTNAQGDVQRRRPVGVLQHIQAGVPGLRNQLPLGR